MFFFIKILRKTADTILSNLVFLMYTSNSYCLHNNVINNQIVVIIILTVILEKVAILTAGHLHGAHLIIQRELGQIHHAGEAQLQPEIKQTRRDFINAQSLQIVHYA